MGAEGSRSGLLAGWFGQDFESSEVSSEFRVCLRA